MAGVVTRVLLFVQTGDGRPKCILRAVPEHWSRRSGERLREFYHDKALGDVRLAWMYGGWIKRFRAADRWWLVECENAEAGRAVIALHEEAGATAAVTLTGPECAGRILASGGKQHSVLTWNKDTVDPHP